MEGYKVTVDFTSGQQKIEAYCGAEDGFVTYMDGEWQYPAPSEDNKAHLRSMASFLAKAAKAKPKPKG